MNNPAELNDMGIPLVIARMMVEQAIRMHGAMPQAAGGGGQQQEAHTPWNAADLQEFPKPEQGGSIVMGLAPKEKLLSHLRRIVYYATMRSEDIGDRCSDVINRGGSMSEEDFVALDSGALKADQQGLAAVITGSMPDATLQWLESQVGVGASGLRMMYTLAKPYLKVQKTGVEAATAGVINPKPIVHKADLSMALAAWHSNRKVLEELGEQPSDYQLQRGLHKMIKTYAEELRVSMEVDERMAKEVRKEEYTYKALFDMLMAKGLDWQSVPRAAAKVATGTAAQLCMAWMRGDCRLPEGECPNSHSKPKYVKKCNRGTKCDKEGCQYDHSGKEGAPPCLYR